MVLKRSFEVGFQDLPSVHSFGQQVWVTRDLIEPFGVSVHPIFDRDTWSSHDVQEIGRPIYGVAGDSSLVIQPNEPLELGQEEDRV